jgi:hypothetical protein
MLHWSGAGHGEIRARLLLWKATTDMSPNDADVVDVADAAGAE